MMENKTPTNLLDELFDRFKNQDSENAEFLTREDADF